MKGTTLLAAAWIVFQGLIPPAGRAAGKAPSPLTEEEVLRRVEKAPAESERPGDDALVLYEGIFADFAGGKSEVRHQRLVKIYSEWAVGHLGDPRLSYDRSREELVVHASRTFLPNGSHADTPENGYNEVTPDGLDRSVDHLDIREMVVTHIGLERGVAIFLDWTVREKEGGSLPFHGIYFVHGDFPALERVIVASGLHGEGVNPPGALHQLGAPEGADGERLVWRVRNAEAAPHAMGGRKGDQLPWVALSSDADWLDAVGRVVDRIEESAEKRASLVPLLDEMEKDEPPLGARDRLEKWCALASNRTSLVRYDPWIDMTVPRTVDDVIRRSTATPLERCALLLACCREGNLDARLVIPSRWEALSAKVPALEALGDPLLRVEMRGQGSVWVDPVRGLVEAASPLAGGMKYFERNEKGFIGRNEVAETLRHASLSIYWDLAAGEGRCDVAIGGRGLAGIRFDEPESGAREWVAGWCEGAEAKNVRIFGAGGTGIRFASDVSASLPEADDRGRIVLALPLPPIAPSEMLPAPPDPAHASCDGLLFGGPARVRLRWKVRLPEGWRALAADGERVECRGGSLRVRRSTQGDLIGVDYTLTWDGSAVRPEEYTAYRALFTTVLDDRLTRLVLVQEGES